MPYKQVDFYANSSLTVTGNNQTPAGTSGSLKPQGFIFEAAATNLATYSYNISRDNIGYYMTTDNAANFAVTGETTAPDNTYTASKFVFTGASVRIDQIYSAVPAAGWYTLSVWLKGSAGTVVQVSFLSQTTGNVEPAVYLNGQWQRFSVRKYFNSGEVFRIHVPIIRGAMGTSVTAATGETGVYATYVYTWGIQIEAGSAATSYIPTYGATATRAADVSTSAATTRASETAVITGTNFSNWYNSTQGSIYVEATPAPNVASTGDPVVYLSDNITSSLNAFYLDFDGGLARNYCFSRGSLVAGLNLGAVTAGTPYKLAGGYQLDNFAASKNGNTVVTDAGGNVPTGSTHMIIGRDIYNNLWLNSTIKKIVYYPVRLSNTQLQALTV